MRWVTLRGTDRGVLEDTRRWSRHAGEMEIEKPQFEEVTATNGEGEDGACVINDRAPLGALVVLVLVAFAAGCGSASDRGQAHQDAKEKVEAKGQQARQEAREKVNAKKREINKQVEAKKQALKKQVDDLQKEVTELQKEINAYEQKEQQQQINQLKKALKELQQKVEAQQ